VRPEPSPTDLLSGWTAGVSEVSRFSCRKFVGVFWGLRLRRTDRGLAVSPPFLLPSAHYKNVGVRISSFVASSPSPKLVASLARSVYKVGEAVEVTVTLENAGKESFYVPKELNSGYDDVGFQVYLLRNGEPYCVVTAEYNCLTKKTKRQTIEQLLSDRFLLLPSGGMIGFHARLPTSCNFGMPALPPANYEVVADYSGSGGCLPDLSNKRTPFPVLHSKVEGVRIQFELTE
jgi:hypothetical protein